MEDIHRERRYGRHAERHGHAAVHRRAARVGAAGHGGQVLLSQTTAALVERALPPDVTLRDLGPHRLKDFHHPERIAQLVIADLPADFPSLKTLDSHPNNLPTQPTSLIGREREIVAVCALLRRDEVRLVTLTGPGGTGKTRLALQVAAELTDDYGDGVVFAELAPVSDPDQIPAAIAQVLGMLDTGNQPIRERLKSVLRTKALLLVLDNFEQVVVAAALVDARRRHAAFFATWAEDVHCGLTAGSLIESGHLVRELDNIRAALDWSLTRDDADALYGLKLFGGAWVFWFTGYRTEGGAIAERALACASVRDQDLVAAHIYNATARLQKNPWAARAVSKCLSGALRR